MGLCEKGTRNPGQRNRLGGSLPVAYSHGSASNAVLRSVAQLYPTLCDPMDCSHQAPLSMGFSRQEYWSGLPFPSPGDLPHPATEPASLVSPALADRFFTTSATWEALVFIGKSYPHFTGG